MPCKKEEMWKRVFEAWYSVAPNVLKNFTMQCQGDLQILLKQKEMQQYTDFVMLAYTVIYFHWNVFKVCCCVFHSKIFDIYMQMLSDYTLI